MTYRVTAEHDTGWWGLTVTDGLPDGHVVATQARRLGTAETAAREAIAFALEVDPTEVDIDLEVIDRR